MPALPSAPGVLRIDLQLVLHEDLHAKCRTFYQYTGTAPTNAQLATMAASVRAAFSADLASLMSTNYHLFETIVTDLSSPTAAIGSDSTSVVGTRTGHELSAATCVLQSFQLQRRYRGGHPRIYWPFGVGEDLADEQTWTAGFVTVVNGGLSTFGTAINSAINVWGSSLGHVAVSYYHGFTVFTGTTGRARNISTPRAAPVIDLTTGFKVQIGVAAQRKRLLHLA